MDSAAQRQAELIERAVRGDTTALSILLCDGHETLCRRIDRRIPSDLRGDVAAEDIAQEAYTQAFRHITNFRPRGPPAFERWLATVALRRLRNAITRHRAAKRGGGTLTVPINHCVSSSITLLLALINGHEQTPSRTAAAHEAVEAVQAALCQLPEDYQQAVRLVYLDGLPVKIAAQRMGRTERAVHNLCYKAKEKLRELLGSSSRFFSDG